MNLNLYEEFLKQQTAVREREAAEANAHYAAAMPTVRIIMGAALVLAVCSWRKAPVAACIVGFFAATMILSDIAVECGIEF